MANQPMKCKHCKTAAPGTKIRNNPYEEDVNSKIVREAICDSCMSKLSDDI